MKRAEFTSRFGVGHPDRLQSGVWRVWADQGKSDVYVAVRTIAGTFKVSLHESGACNASITRQAFEKDLGVVEALEGGRHIDQWHRRTHTGSLLSIPLRIAFPESELRWRSAKSPQDTEVQWLPPPPGGHSIDVLCTFTSQAYSAEDFPWRTDGGKLLKRAPLDNGELFWLTWLVYPTPLGLADKIEGQRERSKAPAPVVFNPDGDSLGRADRLLIGETGPGNVRILTDASAFPRDGRPNMGLEPRQKLRGSNP